MKLKTLSFAVLSAIALASSASAATVVWNTVQQVTGASNVIANTTGLAVAYGTGGATVNGVTFAQGSLAGNTQNGITISLTGFDNIDPTSYSTNGTGGSPSATNSRVPSGMADLLKGGAYTNAATPASVTLSGLTVGKEYTVQFFVADYRNEDLGWGASYNRNETITSGNTSGALNYLNNPTGPASFVVGTFTADAATQVFDFTANQSAQINAINVIPEPSAALLGGLGLLALLRRRR
jgi:hypothetical protein